MLAQTKIVAPKNQPDLNTTYLYVDLGGFIPSSQSYRLNFSNSFIGLPIEIGGGLLFPAGADLYVPLTIRYERREADFITGMTVDVISIEPGVRYFFQRLEQAKELRIFGGAELILADASAAGVYDVSSDGTVSGSGAAEKDYLNLGFGIDLGLTYPLTPMTALDLTVHLAGFFTDPVSNGGLGNIGGVSITGAYRFGF